eukprot:TRINITY_DN8095_c0_g1_i1.p3 TRINITY_DN8095_c0_g1~~TRINITY_DN8095_c0_g1_i1.p3  ORF type:complete len:129 (+),score=7.96 TRINITY_DN8095_c0_g1_i1:1484-1870(+)
MGLGACRASNYCLAPAVVFAAISVVLGIATLAIFLNWVYAERNDIDARDLPSERQLVSGPSVIAFAIGVVCLALGALLESFALCCIQREARHPLADIQRRPQVQISMQTSSDVTVCKSLSACELVSLC